MPSLDEILVTIAATYDAGLDEALWEGTLHRVSRMLGGTGAAVAFQDSASRFARYHSVGYSPVLNTAYAEHYRLLDPILAFVSKAPRGVYTDRMVMPKADLRRLEIHNEFGLPNDMDSVMQVFAFRAPGYAGLISAGRSVRAGDFEQEHVETLGLLLPHLERAMRLQFRLGAARLHADSATEAEA